MHMTTSSHRGAVFGTIATAVALTASLLMASPASAANGTIVGTVTAQQTSSPVANISVYAFSLDGTFRGSATTNSSGQYSLPLAPGSYRLQFFDLSSSLGLVDEWSGDSLFESSASSVVVPDGGSTTVNAALAQGGAIAGSVTSASAGFMGAMVFAFDPTLRSWEYVRNAIFSTVSPEAYTVQGLSPTLGYRIIFAQGCEGADCALIAPRWNGNAATVNSAPDIAVSAGGTTSNVNVTLTTNRTTPVDRIEGANRYETSAKISERYDPADVDTVYLANGVKFPDALSAAPAAVHRDAPLLLTRPDDLPTVIADALSRLDPDTVIIVGSEASVSAGVQTLVEQAVPGVTVERIGGANRFETSRMISEDAFGDGADTAWLATGAGFADALSAAPVAGKNGSPVILVDGSASSIDPATATLLTSLGVSKVEIAGSAASVSDGIAASVDALAGIQKVTRRGGVDRYQTSQIINANRWLLSDEVYLVTGLGFADALSGAALAGRDGMPMYSVPGTCVRRGTKGSIWDLTPEKLIVLGGESTVSPAAAALTVC